MSTHDQRIQEVVDGLEGLITLNEWQKTLLVDLRDKARTAVRTSPPSGAAADESDSEGR